jgi:hypothetical protein
MRDFPVALKGHRFSRAGDGSKEHWASAPEGMRIRPDQSSWMPARSRIRLSEIEFDCPQTDT